MTKTVNFAISTYDLECLFRGRTRTFTSDGVNVVLSIEPDAQSQAESILRRKTK